MVSEIIGSGQLSEISETVKSSRVGKCERWISCLWPEGLVD